MQGRMLQWSVLEGGGRGGSLGGRIASLGGRVLSPGSSPPGSDSSPELCCPQGFAGRWEEARRAEEGSRKLEKEPEPLHPRHVSLSTFDLVDIQSHATFSSRMPPN